MFELLCSLMFRSGYRTKTCIDVLNELVEYGHLYLPKKTAKGKRVVVYILAKKGLLTKKKIYLGTRYWIVNEHFVNMLKSELTALEGCDKKADTRFIQLIKQKLSDTEPKKHFPLFDTDINQNEIYNDTVEEEEEEIQELFEEYEEESE